MAWTRRLRAAMKVALSRVTRQRSRGHLMVSSVSIYPRHRASAKHQQQPPLGVARAQPHSRASANSGCAGQTGKSANANISSQDFELGYLSLASLSRLGLSRGDARARSCISELCTLRGGVSFSGMLLGSAIVVERAQDTWDFRIQKVRGCFA